MDSDEFASLGAYGLDPFTLLAALGFSGVDSVHYLYHSGPALWILSIICSTWGPWCGFCGVPVPVVCIVDFVHDLQYSGPVVCLSLSLSVSGAL